MIPRRKLLDGPWLPNWTALTLWSAMPALWALIGAAWVWRPDPATLTLVAVAAVYAALCAVAFAAMAWALGLLILDTVVDPIVRAFTRPRSRP